MPSLVAVLLYLTTLIAAQSSTLIIHVTADGRPVEGALVRVAGTPLTTNVEGLATATVAPGTHRVEVSFEGFLTVQKDIAVGASGQKVEVTLDPIPEHEETITVSSTRSNKRLEDQPMRVEVLVREEIEEKMLMTPGDIVMMLNEMGGMRVQSTSPSLGAAAVRVQGMRGRYTRFLSDGLPLFGEQPGGLGLLQIPPMDLGQVEVIKGVASALYGAGAMGGVVDLISRRPGHEPEREVLLNASTRGGSDGILWYSTPLNASWGFTFLGGGHFQVRNDVNDDGWADLPRYARGVARPRIFWDNRTGSSFFATVGITAEDRKGGTSSSGGPLDYRHGHVEALDTFRIDGGAVGRTLLKGKYLLTARGAAARGSHDHTFGDVLERDRHVSLFGETTIQGTAGPHAWVLGTAIQRDSYTPRDVPRFAYAYTVPGVFAQDDIALTAWWSATASARADWHSEFGWFFSPRLSSLVRGGGWTSRVSFGTGFYAPSALTEETEAAGLTRLEMPRPLEAERGRSFSVDLTREVGSIAATATFFRSQVDDPVYVERVTDYQIFNLADPVTNTGMELLGTFRRAPFAVTGSYTFVRSRERYAGETQDVPLTPRHAAGIVAMAEWEDEGRIGLEWYYTGEQRLEGDPFRTHSEPYTIIGLLVERRFGRYRVFVNGENLTDTRQTKWSPMLRPYPSPDGRIATDVWAPLEGRTINGGVRISF
jgi:outer membrane receptor for ferrienterochelin and colicins